MRHYWSYESKRAYEKGSNDARWGSHKSFDYDKWSDRERDRAYFDGYRDEERRQEDERLERMREEERVEDERIRRAQREREEQWRMQAEEEEYYRQLEQQEDMEPQIESVS
jgi:hypothetical protein